jgi:hypothetical protein
LEECIYTGLLLALEEWTLYRIFGYSGRVHSIWAAMEECTVSFCYSGRVNTVQNLLKLWKSAQHLGSYGRVHSFLLLLWKSEYCSESFETLEECTASGQLWKSEQFPFVTLEECTEFVETLEECTGWAALEKRTITIGLVALEECTASLAV